ncbi:MAG: methionine synthase [Planctomycetota bacterium]|jgi:5-methyltetrahydrofolate--homocysteine methyltransferase|nr:methionine synthase [Planctomycetota bacterium]MDP6941447.1 methionine synthase [Planctomycetota bacterium]
MRTPAENDPFLSALRKRILVLDGAMGTFIQAEGLSGNNDDFSRTHPEVIAKIHQSYIDAGADVIETNTFGANRISQADYGLEEACYEMNLSAAQIARKVADAATESNPDQPRFVAGSMGPTNRTASMSSDVEDPGARAVLFEELVEAYAEQAKGLLDGGCDLLLVETVFDTLNCKAALFAIDSLFEEREEAAPVVVSGTVTDASGRTLSGQTVSAFWASVSHFPLTAIGFNCALGPEQMRPHLSEISELAHCATACYPNAGLPNELGGYDLGPEEMAAQIREFGEAGLLNLVGGCCGTTPAHIAAMKNAVADIAPRAIPARKGTPILSGLECLEFRDNLNFVNIGERCNVAGSRRFARLIREESYEEALEVARLQVENGAQILDICMDDGLLESASCMRKFLNLLMADPDICCVPVMLDSSDWRVIEEGLRAVQGRCVVNSLSLKDGEAEFLRRAQLVKRYGASVVVMAFDEEGQAVDVDRRIEIVERARGLLLDVGFYQDEIVFDLNILAVATGMEEHNPYAVSFLESTKLLSERYPGLLLSGGVSNLSFSFRGADRVREAMHSVFLYHAIQAGLRLGIVHAGQLALYEDIPADLRTLSEAVVLNQHPDAGAQLLQWAQEHSGDACSRKETKEAAWRGLPPAKRLAQALVSGQDSFLEEDLPPALEDSGSALAVIEGPLMTGMNQVGELFASGRMFLPQVVKSARVMKKAVAWLQPYLEEGESGTPHSRGTILLATVKGDVHDIGKNIASVVLACNGYKIVDLGVMVTCEDILKGAYDCKADLIGLSGLITPSLSEMEHVASEMVRVGLNVPLLIGGATTSNTHTAIKISPLKPDVVQVSDASQAVGVVAALVGEDPNSFIAKQIEFHSKIRAEREGREERVVLTLEEARKRAVVLSGPPPPPPSFLGTKSLDALPFRIISEFIDWRPFFQAWEIKNPRSSAGEELFENAQTMLDELLAAGSLRGRATFGFWEACSELEEVHLSKAELPVLLFPRQLRDGGKNRPNRCLADFISNSPGDHLGAFAVTSGLGLEELVLSAEEQNDDYRALLLKTIADRLAEASAEWLHFQVRTKFWGYAPNEVLEQSNLLKEKYQGIRPAPGYPACPDLVLNRDILALLDESGAAGLQVTDSNALLPASSVCGFYFARPEAHYFGIGKSS